MGLRLLSRKFITLVCCGAILVLLTACNEQQVAGPVDQRQANEIVAYLSSNGIGASVTKERRGNNFTVLVRRSDYFAAAGLLAREGLPREVEPSFFDLIAVVSVVVSVVGIIVEDSNKSLDFSVV